MKFRVVRWEGAAPTPEALRERLRAARCTAVEWSDPPGHTDEAHAHDHDEAIALVCGGITFEIGGVEYPLSPGDILFLPAGTVHAAQADGARGATYLIGSRKGGRGSG